MTDYRGLLKRYMAHLHHHDGLVPGSVLGSDSILSDGDQEDLAALGREFRQHPLQIGPVRRVAGPRHFFAVVCGHPAPPPTFLTMEEAQVRVAELGSGPGACRSHHAIVYINPPKGWALTPVEDQP